VIVNKGVDQMDLSTEAAKINDAGVVRNFGHMLADVCSVAPDGIVCYFPNYKYMEDIVMHWNGMGILDDVLKNKLIFIESRNVEETSISLAGFHKACETGRGAIFLGLARGKMADGMRLSKDYGKTVIVFGVPLQYGKSRSFLARVKYLRDKLNSESVQEHDLVILDGLRLVAQCIGGMFRSREDYGMIILADRRYLNVDKLDKLPGVFRKALDRRGQGGISSDQVLGRTIKFFKRVEEMAEKGREGEMVSLGGENGI